jgi:molecular chaperone DnaK
MVNVSAKDLGTGKEQKITITASSGLSKEEVERMMKDADAHAEDDKKRREEIETRNKADQAVYAAEKMLQDMGAKLAPADKASVETAIESLKTAMTNNDTAGMNRAMEQLTQAQHKAAEALYKQAGTAASSGGTDGPEGAAGAGPAESAGSAGAGPGGGGDVIDAEVVEEDRK